MSPGPAQPADKPGRIALISRLLRSEGPAAVLDRTLDRLAHRRRLRSATPIGLDAVAGLIGQLPVLNLSPMPLSPLRGGSLIQLLDRLAEESLQLRPVALLSPAGRQSWQLEVHHGSRHAVVTLPAGSLAETVARAVSATGSHTVHLECLSGLDLEQVPRLTRLASHLVLSVHDFSLLCRRPHLLEQPAQRFCGLSHDRQHCLRCLRHDWPVDDDELTRLRNAASQALAAANAVVFPSTFLQHRYHSFLGEQDARQMVIAPASHTVVRPPRPPPQPFHVAFVGGVKRVKGGALLGEVVENARRQLPGLCCFALGEAEPDLARDLRRLPRFQVRGYYRAGHLPRHLHRRRISLAVLPTIVPETYCLAVDECLAAGVPVIAFDHGAVGERLRRLGVGQLVPLAEGAAGLARAIVAACSGHPLDLPPDIAQHLPTPAGAARHHLKVYGEVGSL